MVSYHLFLYELLDYDNVTVFGAGQIFRKTLCLSINPERRLILTCKRKNGKNCNLVGQTQLKMDQYY